MSVTWSSLSVDIVKSCIFSFISPLDKVACIRVNRAWKRNALEQLNSECWFRIEGVLKSLSFVTVTAETREEQKKTLMSSESIKQHQQNGSLVLQTLLKFVIDRVKLQIPVNRESSDKAYSLFAVEFARLGLGKSAQTVTQKMTDQDLRQVILNLVEKQLLKLKIKLQRDPVVRCWGTGIAKSTLYGSEIDLEINSGFNFVFHARKRFGFMHDFTIKEIDLEKDLEVIKPGDVLVKEKVCGVLAHFLASSPYEYTFEAQFSPANRDRIIKYASDPEEILDGKISVIFELSVFSFDILEERYYKRLFCNVAGTLEKIEIDDEPDTRVKNPINYKCRFSVQANIPVSF